MPVGLIEEAIKGSHGIKKEIKEGLGATVLCVGIKVIGQLNVLTENLKALIKPTKPRSKMMMLLKVRVVQVLFLLMDSHTILLMLYIGIQTRAPLLI